MVVARIVNPVSEESLKEICERRLSGSSETVSAEDSIRGLKRFLRTNWKTIVEVLRGLNPRETKPRQ